MRKLVSIRTITDIQPIPDADAIDVATVDDGWKVVVKKNEFNIGEKCVYFEIDSFVPTEIAPFLSKGKEPREYNGVKGEKLRTVKLRKQISQGLILPLSQFPQFEGIDQDEIDLAEMIGVQKWEAPLHASLQGKARGNFPSYIRKTDQERIQNIWRKVPRDLEYEVSLKVDGSSMTTYLYQDPYDGELTPARFGVCSRNLDLTETDDNSYWKMAGQLDLETKLRNLGRNIAIQMELYGSGINGNWENITNHQVAVFDIWDINTQSYLGSEERQSIAKELGLPHVPIITVRKFDFETMDEALEYAKGPSIHNKIREGLVWKSLDGTFSFKTINNDFLMKQKD